MVILGVDNINTKYHQEIPCKGYSWIILRETRLEKDDGNAVCPNVNEYEDGDLSYLEWRRRWLSVELLTRRVCLLVCLSAYQAAHSSPQRQLAACSCHSSDRDPVQVFLLKELWKHNTTTYVPCLKCDLWEPYNLTRKGEFLIKCKQNKLETQDLIRWFWFWWGQQVSWQTRRQQVAGWPPRSEHLSMMIIIVVAIKRVIMMKVTVCVQH